MKSYRFWGASLFLFLILLQTAEVAVAEEATERFEKAAQRLVQAINTQNYSDIQENLFKNGLKDDSTKGLEKLFKTIKDRFDKIEKIDSPKVLDPNRVVLTAHCPRRNLDVTITMNDEDKIVGLSIRSSKQKFEEMAQQMVKAINTQDFSIIEEDLSEVAFNDDALETLEKLIAGIKNQFGEIGKLGPPKVLDLDRATFIAHCDLGKLDLTIGLDRDNKIMGLSVGYSKQAFEKVAKQLLKAINTQDHTVLKDVFPNPKWNDDSLGKLKELVAGLKKKFGKIEKIGPPKVLDSNRAVVPTHCDHGDLDILIVLNQDDKIIELSFAPHKEEAL